MLNKRNLLAVVLAFVAGFFLIISGEQGPSGTYSLIIEKLSILINDQVILNIARAIGTILIIISSLGGFAVIIGGLFIYKEKLFFGKTLIALGTGFGIINFLFLAITLITTQELALVIARYSIFGWLGITFSLIARTTAKKP